MSISIQIDFVDDGGADHHYRAGVPADVLARLRSIPKKYQRAALFDYLADRVVHGMKSYLQGLENEHRTPENPD